VQYVVNIVTERKKKEIIRRKRMHQMKRALATDTLVISCHINIPSVRLFF